MAENKETKHANGTAGTSHSDLLCNVADKSSVAPGILTANATQGPWSVDAVVANIPGGPPETDSSSPVPFFHMLERLKTTKREGWRRFGIKQYIFLRSPLPMFLLINFPTAANR
jgi:putative hydrolase of HD superfamily